MYRVVALQLINVVGSATMYIRRCPVFRMAAMIVGMLPVSLGLGEAATVETTTTAAHVGPRLNLFSPDRAKAANELILPGGTQVFRETAIPVRANGYLKRWRVDIGDEVKKRSPFAEVETPEIDPEPKETQAKPPHLVSAHTIVVGLNANGRGAGGPSAPDQSATLGARFRRGCGDPLRTSGQRVAPRQPGRPASRWDLGAAAGGGRAGRLDPEAFGGEEPLAGRCVKPANPCPLRGVS
jgi:hypothetical protein